MTAIPRSSLFPKEETLLGVLLWSIAALFLGIMVWTWVAAERAAPVMLDLETGRPAAKRPPL